ncbi:MAG: hypothetical protein ACRC5C_14290 [Bacilli bacterium]
MSRLFTTWANNECQVLHLDRTSVTIVLPNTHQQQTHPRTDTLTFYSKKTFVSYQNHIFELKQAVSQIATLRTTSQLLASRYSMKQVNNWDYEMQVPLSSTRLSYQETIPVPLFDTKHTNRNV